MDLCADISDVENELKFTNSLSQIDDYCIKENVPDFDKITAHQVGENVIECCKRSDLVFLALHRDIRENSKLQALLELNGIRHTGSNYYGCMLAMDKNISKLIAKQNNINTAVWNINCNENAGYPCITKPLNGGSSIGITIVNDKKKSLKPQSNRQKI